jgi:hypothetical protein
MGEKRMIDNKTIEKLKWTDDRFWKCKFCGCEKHHITHPELSPARNIVIVCVDCKMAQTFCYPLPITEEDFWSERHAMYFKEETK